MHRLGKPLPPKKSISLLGDSSSSVACMEAVPVKENHLETAVNLGAIEATSNSSF